MVFEWRSGVSGVSSVSSVSSVLGVEVGNDLQECSDGTGE
jgi:hypothetical protein